MNWLGLILAVLLVVFVLVVLRLLARRDQRRRERAAIRAHDARVAAAKATEKAYAEGDWIGDFAPVPERLR